MLPEKRHHLQTIQGDPALVLLERSINQKPTNDEFGNSHMGTSITQAPVLSDGTGQLTILHICCYDSNPRKMPCHISGPVSMKEKMTVYEWRIEDFGTTDIEQVHCFRVWEGF